MLERLQELRAQAEQMLARETDTGSVGLNSMRAATAQLLLTTAVVAAIERLGDSGADDEDGHMLPRTLGLAPLLVGSLTAAAQLEHVRRPREQTSAALKILNGASVALGGALLAYDMIVSGGRAPRQLGPLAFASAGLLGMALERQEAQIQENERTLRRRAKVVERLVPPRKPKLDRVVVHV
jgi:hypothetical protein